MALYRTKPEEVEAIQYTGSMTQPFEENIPAWVWGAMSVGTLTFRGHGLEINYNGLTEQVLPNDWLVLHNDGIIRCCNDGVFKMYYTPARKRKYDDTSASPQDAGSAEVGTVGVVTGQAA